MKEQYIRSVKKELHLPRKKRMEILRDLDEIFASAAEHGETEQQVIGHLGTPKDFADSTAEQFGIDNTASRRRKGILSGVAALLIAAASLAVYAAVQIEKAPKGAIGQADAMTSLQVEGLFGFDALQIALVASVLAFAFAVVQIGRTVRKNRREP